MELAPFLASALHFSPPETAVAPLPRESVLGDPDLLGGVLSFLHPLPVMARALFVCKRWCDVVTSPQLNRALVQSHYPHLARLKLYNSNPAASCGCRP